MVLIYGMKERFLKNKGEITEIPGVVTSKGSGSPIIGVPILVYVIRENLMGIWRYHKNLMGIWRYHARLGWSVMFESVNNIIVYMLIS